MTALPFDIDEVNEMVRAEFPGTPNRCVALGTDFVIASCAVQSDHIRPGGFISGPTQFALIDCALWFLSFVALQRIEPMAMTSELSIRYLRPAQGELLYCRATLEAMSRRSVVGTAHVWCEDRPAKITATGQGTYAIPLAR